MRHATTTVQLYTHAHTRTHIRARARRHTHAYMCLGVFVQLCGCAVVRLCGCSCVHVDVLLTEHCHVTCAQSELKHGRVAMLAVVGYVAPDLGWRLPGITASSLAAHDASLGICGGSMGQIFVFIGLLELFAGLPAVIYMVGGGDRAPGDYNFDPLGFGRGASAQAAEDMQWKELRHGRLAMLGFSGIVTQAALGHPEFPYASLPW